MLMDNNLDTMMDYTVTYFKPIQKSHGVTRNLSLTHQWEMPVVLKWLALLQVPLHYAKRNFILSVFGTFNWNDEYVK